MSRSPLAAPGLPALGLVLGVALLGTLCLPLLGLLAGATPGAIAAGVAHPLFSPALWLSLRTSLCALAVAVVCGAPLAWWLATTDTRLSRTVELLVALPIVLPPAVVGVALLQTLGRRGLFGPALAGLGVELPFSTAAVTLAQVVVSAPLFVHAAANAFRKLDLDVLLVARTLGATPGEAFLRVAVPGALPGLVVGASLAWARALGEFGATLLFAGNLPGRTQTLPLAIFSALESDVRLAVVLSLTLAALAALLLLGLRALPWLASARPRPGGAA